jgi:hypothetical protein
MDRRRFLLLLLAGGCAQSQAPALSSPDRFWTLWRAEPRNEPEKWMRLLTRERCEQQRDFHERWAGVYVEEEHGIMHLRRKPPQNPPRYRCLPDGESYK